MDQDLKIEFRHFTNDDFSEKPNCFTMDFPDDEVRLIRHDNCGMILQGENNPHYYFHNLDETKSRWSGIIRLGDTPLSFQSRIENMELNQSGLLKQRYGVISNDPLQFGVESNEGIPFQFIYDENGCHLMEGENGLVLDVKGEWFPYGLICHIGSEYNIPFMHLPVHLKGTYQGNSIEFLACIDRIFAPKGKEKEVMKNATNYISSYCSGIREDGRREWMIGLLCHDNGQGLGIYWIDGEEPIISNEVEHQGIWEELPYVNDGTMVCVDTTWKFGGKEIHVNGKWGSKGFTEEPNLARHGQSQMFGTWYEGNEEYHHRVWNTFNENMEAYKDSMLKRGFTIKE